MSITNAEAMQALSRFGELAWFALPIEYNDAYDYYQVPYLGWRYTSPQEDLAQYIEEALRKIPTQVDWELDRTRRNWLVLPSRILREAHGLEDPDFSNVVHSINTHDQEFCLKAISDLELIIRHLQQIPTPGN
ncbi:hypothetical protein KBP30_16110 [Streptomyces sp. Go40/10]|uniref:hypothetical protein n=1 Tax=Streptomyces sp. Go40/10 TaxID=2825844 RepID=UPI001E5B3F62|nr:hypothetical protein [Streptomyces sp. Go40/10]UFR02611.1 hypothetical protein KBP30_16110 [Streptomyces sp. Go40/10]